jgi:hypothetical protein
MMTPEMRMTARSWGRLTVDIVRAALELVVEWVDKEWGGAGVVGEVEIGTIYPRSSCL